MHEVTSTTKGRSKRRDSSVRMSRMDLAQVRLTLAHSPHPRSTAHEGPSAVSGTHAVHPVRRLPCMLHAACASRPLVLPGGPSLSRGRGRPRVVCWWWQLLEVEMEQEAARTGTNPQQRKVELKLWFEVRPPPQGELSWVSRLGVFYCLLASSFARRRRLHLLLRGVSTIPLSVAHSLCGDGGAGRKKTGFARRDFLHRLVCSSRADTVRFIQ